MALRQSSRTLKTELEGPPIQSFRLGRLSHETAVLLLRLLASGSGDLKIVLHTEHPRNLVCLYISHLLVGLAVNHPGKLHMPVLDRNADGLCWVDRVLL